MALVWFIFIILFIMKPHQSMEINFQTVELGDHAVVSCEIFYHNDITWLKNQPENTPIIVLLAGLINGNDESWERHHTSRLFETYYFSNWTSHPKQSSATQGLVSGLETQNDSSATSSLASPLMPPGSYGLTFIHLYATAVGLGLLGMILAVCITHHKAMTT
ncbi:hypothetical protein UPYG_G00042090 [Umbra pygmaea]|uniref:Uncharacterized protein n=1 Tax=Umbra pygmaea TaxID=75934 RepID=A0ABD0YC48_UMBPY